MIKTTHCEEELKTCVPNVTTYILISFILVTLWRSWLCSKANVRKDLSKRNDDTDTCNMYVKAQYYVTDLSISSLGTYRHKDIIVEVTRQIFDSHHKPTETRAFSSLSPLFFFKQDIRSLFAKCKNHIWNLLWCKSCHSLSDSLPHSSQNSKTQSSTLKYYKMNINSETHTWWHMYAQHTHPHMCTHFTFITSQMMKLHMYTWKHPSTLSEFPWLLLY